MESPKSRANKALIGEPLNYKSRDPSDRAERSMDNQGKTPSPHQACTRVFASEKAPETHIHKDHSDLTPSEIPDQTPSETKLQPMSYKRSKP